jgi:hypothetical protein
VQLGQLDTALETDAGSGEVVAEDAFGFGLGQEQQVRVGGVGQAEVEQGHRHLAATGVQAQLHGPVAAFDELVGDAESGENFQRARLDGQGSGLVDPVVGAVDERGRTPCAASWAAR